MSLRPEVIGPVPEETARVARAAFPAELRHVCGARVASPKDAFDPWAPASPVVVESSGV